MNKHKWMSGIFGLVIIASMLLASCTPAATPTTAPAEPTTAPAQPTAAPAEPTTGPTAAPAEPTAAPTTPVAEGPVTGGRITIIDNSGFYTLDPYQTPWFTLTQGAIYDNLIALRPDMTGYDPNLAESWDISEDGLTLTFHLRPGITFTDGTPCDAAAIKWNLDKYLDPNWPHSVNGVWVDYVDNFAAQDATTFVVTFKSPYAAFFSDLQTTYIVSPTAYEKLGKDGFGRAPVGTGAWIAKEIVENDHVLYVRNPDYKWSPSFYSNKGAVYPDELYIKFITDTAATYAALETGEATLIGLPAQFITQAQSNPDIALNKGTDWSDFYLGFNDSVEPFKTPEFRKAIAYAINRDEIIQAAFEGEAFALYSSLAPSTWGYNEAQNDYGKAADGYNPDKAKEILAGLGYTAGSDGVLVGKDGKALKFKFNFPAGEDMKRVAETIQAELADVGIQVELGEMEAAAISQMLQKCQQEMFLRPFGLADASILSAVFASSRMGSSNRNCWTDTKADELIKTADTTLDPAKRAEAVDALVKYLVDQRPHVPLFALYIYTAYRANLKGVIWGANGGAFLNDAYLAQ